MTVERGDLVNLEFLLDVLARDESQPKEIQRDAAYGASVITCGSSSPERVQLVPLAFRIKGHHSIIAEQTIAELPDAVKGEIPARLALAQQMAEQADDGDSYGIDHRLDCLSALEELLAGLQSQGSDELVES